MRTFASYVAPVLFCLISYAWIVSAGRWSDWPAPTYAVNSFADSFLNHQLSLLQEPSSELLMKPDPWARENLRLWLWDHSLYRGKYYFYWGPVPALLTAAARIVSGAPSVSDRALVLIFSCVRVIAGTLLLALLFRGLKQTSVLLRASAVLALGLSMPFPNLIARPLVYEVAITAAQCFLIIASVLAVQAVDAVSSRVRITLTVMAGFASALCIGSRISGIFAVSFLGFFLYACVRAPQRFSMLAAFSAPVFAACLALGWYNSARFGSALEVGTSYQLTTYPVQAGMEYVPFNVYQYLLRPIEFRSVFPYLKFDRKDKTVMGPAWIGQPEYYFPRQTLAGLLYVFPAIFWAPLLFLSGRLVIRERFFWIGTILGPLNFLSCLVLFASTLRYTADLSTGLLICCVLGYSAVVARVPRGWISVVRALFVLSLLSSALLGFLLVFDFPLGYFQDNNPELLKKLVHALSFGRSG